MPAAWFSDPEAELVAILADAFGPGVVSTSYPSATLTGTTVAVQVDLEGGSSEDYPAADRAQVRVTCHAAPGRRSAVKALADDARRHAVTAYGSATVAAVWPLTSRSAVSVDPDTRNLMCWFLVRVDLKPASVAP